MFGEKLKELKQSQKQTIKSLQVRSGCEYFEKLNAQRCTIKRIISQIVAVIYYSTAVWILCPQQLVHSSLPADMPAGGDLSRDQPPAQGLGGTVGGNMIDPDLKATVTRRRVFAPARAAARRSPPHGHCRIRSMPKCSGQEYQSSPHFSGTRPSDALAL